MYDKEERSMKHISRRIMIGILQAEIHLDGG